LLGAEYGVIGVAFAYMIPVVLLFIATHYASAAFQTILTNFNWLIDSAGNYIEINPTGFPSLAQTIPL